MLFVGISLLIVGVTIRCLLTGDIAFWISFTFQALGFACVLGYERATRERIKELEANQDSLVKLTEKLLKIVDKIASK